MLARDRVMPDIPGRGVKCSRGDSRARFIISVGTAILGQAHRHVQETSDGVMMPFEPVTSYADGVRRGTRDDFRGIEQHSLAVAFAPAFSNSGMPSLAGS